MSDYAAQYQDAMTLADRMSINAADQASAGQHESAAALAAAAQAQATLALAAATALATER
ncbi:hypothetical protein [Nocardiopsis sp. NPDC006938]|uniref:hypothetical protein n=1 Tax=Nocardiopsis sp. NPDC006938 TaxID=3364337 RepID=UPI00369A4A57